MKVDAFSNCHPGLNFFYFTIVIGFTMFLQHPVFLLISFFSSMAYALWLNGWRKVLKLNVLFTVPSLLIVALLNPLFNHYGVTTLFYIESSGNQVTLEALVYGLVLGIVLFIVIMWFSCYNVIMTTDKFVYLFGRAIPAISLILSMVFRFVPRFQSQLGLIRNGQKCSGRDISNGSLLHKVKCGLNILSILVTWALENAIETADSMKSRGYGLKGRSAYSIYHITRRDCFMGGWFLGLLGILIAGCKSGAAFAQYNPRILLAGIRIMGHDAPVSCTGWQCMVTFFAFAIFCNLPLMLGLYDAISLNRCRASGVRDLTLTYRMIYERTGTDGYH